MLSIIIHEIPINVKFFCGLPKNGILPPKTCIGCMLFGKEGIMDNKFWDIIFRWMDRIENRLAVIEQDVKELIENKGKMAARKDISGPKLTLSERD